MPLSELLDLWRSDLQRYGGFSLNSLRDPPVRFMLALRLATYLRRGGGPARLPALLLGLWLTRAKWRFGFDLHPDTEIGPGLLLSGHPGGIVVNSEARIGRNCNLGHGVTLGKTNRGERAGVPVLGDRVWVGAGARIVGRVTIGDGAVIGPNAVITTDVAPDAVVVVPRPEVVSQKGSAGYVNRLA
jgi:serine O-acetyltransferase